MPVHKITLQMTVMCEADTLDEAVTAYDNMSLEEIQNATEFGDDIGGGVKIVLAEQLMTADRIRAELQAIGNDGEFFDINIADMADSGDEENVEQLGNQVPIFLTNGGCEYAHNPVVRSKFEELGLGGQVSLDGDEFYPLDPVESEYIAEDVVDALDGSTGAMIGYSALYRNKKYLTPQIEIPVGAENDGREELEVLQIAEDYIRNISPMVEAMGGEVQMDRGFHNCVVVRLLFPLDTVMSWGGPEDWKSRLAVFITNPEVPAYLTNACCEAAHGDKVGLGMLGLSTGEFNGDFYPLTDEEAKFIAEDEVLSLDGRHLAMLGYSALYQGKKFLMPSIEIPFGEEGDEFAFQGEALAAANALVAHIGPKLAEASGRARVDQSEDDRIVIQLLFPFETAAARRDLTGWKRYLSFLITSTKAVDLDTVPESRFEGDNYAVTVRYIGEGEDGEYNPHDPKDIPFVRFDAEKRVDGEWEEFEQDGSYCTRLPATAAPRIHEALARMVVTRLEAAHDKDPENRHKRLLEELSWADINAVAGFIFIEQRNAAFAAPGNGNDRNIDRELLEAFTGVAISRPKAATSGSDIQDIDYMLADAFAHSSSRSSTPGEIHPLDQAALGVAAAGFDIADEKQVAPAPVADLDAVDIVYAVKASFVITAGAYDGVVDKQNMADLINDRGVQDGDIDEMTIIEVRKDDEVIARAAGEAE